jgi:mRNA interferase MazF
MRIQPGEVWMADMGMIAKVRPVVALTPMPGWDELALVNVVQHTGSVRGDNPWELSIPKPFLRDGVFHLQQLASVKTSDFIRRLGVLSVDEFNLVKDGLRERLDL